MCHTAIPRGNAMTPEVQTTWTPLSRKEMAARVAADIPEGWVVNLGIGVPTLVADMVPASREVVFHSENGLLGMGPAPAPDAIDRWLVNAGKQHVTLVSGGSYFHHADSFAMIRGRHLDLCVLGAFEVASNGDLANWTTSADETAPAVGGAMDLAVGAKRLWVVMDHMTKDGRPKVVKTCRFPLTAKGAVARIYTNFAEFDVAADGLRLRHVIDGMSLEELQAYTEAPIRAD
jgi:3-oxoadipate CoA-transferase beta subunit